ncbi:MAG TPA: hypothetical protein VG126_18585, partial [Thermoleophilaceae bacterium]|nr:hypothetical protein [Thermoleophilaceae bacterium]
PPAADESTGEAEPAQSPPAQSPPAQSPPAHSEPPQGEPSPAESSPQAAPTSGGAQSVAHNQSKVIQAVWQVQEGCRTHCYGTSQIQRSEQVSQTTQSATAVSGESGGGGSSATAVNESSTIQFVWQMQIGCVAFCYDTSQAQEASQHSSTSQEAGAESALVAWAENLAQTVQYVFQIQQGCEHECHGTTQHQSSAQSQTTSQSATATGGGDDVDYGSFLVPDWLIAFAQNIGATIQTSFQYQEALCREHCTGDTQLQEAIQRAETDQRAVAMANPPVPEEAPVGEQPPGGPPPGEQPSGEQPAPMGPSGPAQTGAATPSAGGSAAPVRPASLPGRRRKRTVRRQELELRAGAHADGGTRPGGGPGRGHTGSSGDGPGGHNYGGAAGQDAPTRAGAGGLGLAFLPGPAGGSPRPATAPVDTPATGDQLPARVFSVPSVTSPDGSMGWLAILLAAAALLVLAATLRRELATDLRQT